MQLKENFLKNKQKYKSILFFLNKVRKKNSLQNGNNDNSSKESTEPYIDKIVELLNCENIDEICNNFKNLSKEEEQELQNFEVNEGLLKEIETSLMLKIKKLLEEEKNMSNNENKDNNDINNEIRGWNNLGIEKGVDISVEGNKKNSDSQNKNEYNKK